MDWKGCSGIDGCFGGVSGLDGAHLLHAIQFSLVVLMSPVIPGQKMHDSATVREKAF